jgi:hypothetical protein
MLVGAAIILATFSDKRLSEVASQGPHMKRVGGGLLITLGLWFFFLAAANPTFLLP